MPVKKITKKVRKKTLPTKKLNLQSLKQDLVDNLDQFLLDETNVSESQRQKALDKLDRLIKQDLSNNELLSYIQKVKTEKKNNKIEDHQELKDEQNNPSSHVLDLRQLNQTTKQSRSKEKFEVYKNHWARFKEKVNKPDSFNVHEFHYPDIDRKLFDINRFFNFFAYSFKLNHIGSRIIIFALVMALILLPIRGLFWFGQLQNDKDRILDFGKQGMLSLQTGVISASENSYQEAQANFEQALDNFNKAQGVLDEYHQWMLKTASLMPLIGKPISLSQNMLAIATNISEAATILNQTLQTEESLTGHLVFINKQIEETLPYLDAAQENLNGVSTTLLPNDLQVYFDSLKNYLPAITESLHSIHDIFTVLQDVLGHETEKRYLVLFQNNNELRATGGFIGSFALFDIYQGEVINLEIPEGGLYDLEGGQKIKYQAPEALSLVNSYFNIWDANWWPDFPKSAEKISWFFANNGGSSVDGLIAINADVLQELLKILGPVTMEEYGLTITADNLFAVIQEEVELNYDKEANTPKAIIADLVPHILEQLLNSKEKQKEIVTVFAELLFVKDIQLYLHDEELQKQVVSFGWSGSMHSTDRDYLSVINTNIAGGKTDNNIYQTIDHQAEIQANGEIINTIRITKMNKGDEDNPFAGIEGGNVSYIRLYMPLGSKFIEAMGFDEIPKEYFHPIDNTVSLDEDVSKEELKMIDGLSNTEIYTSLGKTVMANWMALKPGETKTAVIKYKLPFRLNLGDPLVNNWWETLFGAEWYLDNYSLLVQTQSGAKRTILNSSVLLPDGLKIVWNDAFDKNNMGITDHSISYSQELLSDQYFGFIVATK